MSNIPQYHIAFINESLILKYLLSKWKYSYNSITIGRTIYFTDRKFIKLHPITSKVILIHELIHVKNYEKYSYVLYTLAYLIPQIFCLFSIVLLFVTSWWIALIWFIFFISPLLSYFRMKMDAKAYTISLYTLYVLSSKYGFKINLNKYLLDFEHSNHSLARVPLINNLLSESLSNSLSESLFKIQQGQRPHYNQCHYDMVDEILKLNIKISDIK